MCMYKIKEKVDRNKVKHRVRFCLVFQSTYKHGGKPLVIYPQIHVAFLKLNINIENVAAVSAIQLWHGEIIFSNLTTKQINLTTTSVYLIMG